MMTFLMLMIVMIMIMTSFAFSDKDNIMLQKDAHCATPMSNPIILDLREYQLAMKQLQFLSLDKRNQDYLSLECKCFFDKTCFSCHNWHVCHVNLSTSIPRPTAHKVTMRLVVDNLDSSRESRATLIKAIARCDKDSQSNTWSMLVEVNNRNLESETTRADFVGNSLETMKVIRESKPLDHIALAFICRVMRAVPDRVNTMHSSNMTENIHIHRIEFTTKHINSWKDCLKKRDMDRILTSLTSDTFSLFPNTCITDIAKFFFSYLLTNSSCLCESSMLNCLNTTLAFNVSSFNGSLQSIILVHGFSAHGFFLPAVPPKTKLSVSIVSQNLSSKHESPWAAMISPQSPPSIASPPLVANSPLSPLTLPQIFSSSLTSNTSASGNSKHKAKYKVPWILFGIVLTMVLICLMYAKYGKFFWHVGLSIKRISLKVGKCCWTQLKEGKWKLWRSRNVLQSQQITSNLSQPHMTGQVMTSNTLTALAGGLPPASSHAAFMFNNRLFSGLVAGAAGSGSAEEAAAKMMMNRPSTINDENHLTYLPYEEWPPISSDIPTITSILYPASSLGNIFPQGEDRSPNEFGSTRKENQARFYDDHRKGNMAPRSSPNEVVAGSPIGARTWARDALRQMELLDGNVDVEISSNPKSTMELLECIGKSIESTGKLIKTAGRFLESSGNHNDNCAAIEEMLGQHSHLPQDVHDGSHSDQEREKIRRILSSKEVTHEIAEMISQLIKSKAEPSDPEEDLERRRNRMRRFNRHLHHSAHRSEASSEGEDNPRSVTVTPSLEQSRQSISSMKGKRKHSRKDVPMHQGSRPSSSKSSTPSSSNTSAKKSSASRSVDREDFATDARSKSIFVSPGPSGLQVPDARPDGEDGIEETDSKIVSTSAYSVDRVFSNMLYNSGESPTRSRHGSPHRSMKFSSKYLSPLGDVKLVDTRVSKSETAVAGALASGKVQSAGDLADCGHQHLDDSENHLSDKLTELALWKGGFPQPGGSPLKENCERQTTVIPIKISPSPGSILGHHGENNVLDVISTVPPTLHGNAMVINQPDEERRKRMKRVYSVADHEDHLEALLKRKKKKFFTIRDRPRNPFPRDSDSRGKEITISSNESSKRGPTTFKSRVSSSSSSSSRLKFPRRRGSLYERLGFRAKLKDKNIVTVDNVDQSTTPNHLALVLYEPTDSDIGEISDSPACPRFKFEELKRATNGFANRLKITKDAYGIFFKGVHPESNIPIAVKVLDHTTRQRPSLNEVCDLSQLRHPHLVELLGFCKHSLGKYYVVYEWNPGGSVDGALFERRHQNKNKDDTKSESIISWKKRFAIIKSVADALSYLHSNKGKPVIMHRNVKANNVMFQSEKLSDFGFAWLMEHGSRQTSSMVSAPIGKHGMIAPEFMASKRATTKSDVYAFGLLALEIVSGRRMIDRKASIERVNLADWVCSLDNKGRVLLDAMDKNLFKLPINSLIETQAETILRLGLACIDSDPVSRPSMAEIVQMLEGEAPIQDSIKQEEFSASIAAPITLFDVNHENSLPGDISQAKARLLDMEGAPPVRSGSNILKLAVRHAYDHDDITFDTSGKPYKRKRSKSLSFVDNNLFSMGLTESSPLATLASTSSASASTSACVAPTSSTTEARSVSKNPLKPLQLQLVDYIPYESHCQASIINLFNRPAATASVVECTDANPSISNLPTIEPISNLPSNTDAQTSSDGASTMNATSREGNNSARGIIVYPSYDQKQPSEGRFCKDHDISLRLPKAFPPKASPRPLGNFESCDSCGCSSNTDGGLQSSSDDGTTTTTPPCRSCSTIETGPGSMENSYSNVNSPLPAPPAKRNCHLLFNTIEGDPRFHRLRKRKVGKNRIIISGPSRIQISKTHPLSGSTPDPLDSSNKNIILSTPSSQFVLPQPLPTAPLHISDSLGTPMAVIPQTRSPVRKSRSFIYITPLRSANLNINANRDANRLLAPESSASAVVPVPITRDTRRQIKTDHGNRHQNPHQNNYLSAFRNPVRSKNLSGGSISGGTGSGSGPAPQQQQEQQRKFLSFPPSPGFGDTL